MNRRIAFLAAAISLATASQAHAETTSSAETQVAAQLLLDADLIEGVDREQLRDAIAAELGVTVVLAGPGVEGRGTMRVRLESPGKVTVSFRAEGGKEVGRTLELPKKPEQAIETIALILGNLVRNEAAELLESLKPKPKPALAPPPPPPLAPPPVIVAPPPPKTTCARPSSWIGLDAVPGVGWHQDDSRAFSFGLIGTFSRGVRGADIASAAAIARGDVCGAQIGGAVSIATGDFQGVQIGGAAAIVAGDVRGAQVGGALSLAGTVHGVQIAPVTVAGDVHGVQLGTVNVAHGDVHGVQLGVVNIARDVDVPIGLISIVSRGRTHFDAWGNETGLAMLEVVHGGRRVHNLYGLGGRIGPRGTRAAFMLGIGFRAVATQPITLDIDATATQLHRTTDFTKSTLVSQIRAVVGVRILDDLALLAGPTWSVMWTNDPEESPQASVGLSHFADDVHGWPGVVLGLRGF